MQIGIPTEIYADEKRVATTPEVAGWLQKLGYTVAIQTGAEYIRKNQVVTNADAATAKRRARQSIYPFTKTPHIA